MNNIIWESTGPNGTIQDNTGLRRLNRIMQGANYDKTGLNDTIEDIAVLY